MLLSTGGLLVAPQGAAQITGVVPDACGPSESLCRWLEVPLDRSGAVPGTVKLQVERARALLSTVGRSIAPRLVPAELIGASPGFCGPSERPCKRLAVALDRSGAVPGTVKLQVERARATNPQLPPLVLLVGGPGQSATSVYDQQAVADTLGRARRHRDVIVYDQRGTGLSGALRCPRLERARDPGTTAAGEACARRLGPGRAFYTSRDSVDDIEAIRRDLDVSKIALLGTSYGTKVALGYAARYPSRVERLVLDSVVPLDGPSPLYLETLTAVPRVLRELCRDRCRRFSPNAVRDIRLLGTRLAGGPLKGKVVDRRGKPRPARMTDLDLLFLLLAGDLEPELRAVLPGVVRSAVRGDPAPILRVIDHARTSDGEVDFRPREFSLGLYAATSCEELSFPWPRTAPRFDRERQGRINIGRLPGSAFGPFPREIGLSSDLLSLCRHWPTTAADPAIPDGPMPRVPALVLAGSTDLRTPLESAQRVAASFPRGRLVRVPGVGHDTIASDSTGCAQSTAERFLLGKASAPCRRQPPRPAIKVSPPSSLRAITAVGKGRTRRARTLSAVGLTLRDFAESLEVAAGEEVGRLFSGGSPRPIYRGGLRAGLLRYRLVKDSAALDGFSFVPGVRVSGVIRRLVSSPRKTRGRLRITGRSAPHGTLILRGRTLTGELGGRRVRIGVSEALAPLTRSGQAASASPSSSGPGSGWRPPHEPIP